MGAASCDGTQATGNSQDTKLMRRGVGGAAVWLLFVGTLGSRARWVGSVKGLG